MDAARTSPAWVIAIIAIAALVLMLAWCAARRPTAAIAMRPSRRYIEVIA